SDGTPSRRASSGEPITTVDPVDGTGGTEGICRHDGTANQSSSATGPVSGSTAAAVGSTQKRLRSNGYVGSGTRRPIGSGPSTSTSTPDTHSRPAAVSAVVRSSPPSPGPGSVVNGAS